MKRRRIARRLLEATAVGVIAAMVAAVGLSGGYFAGFQREAADTYFPSANTDPGIVVVGYDYPTIERWGFPLPRAVQAQIARNLGAAGAAAVVWDVIFASPSSVDPAGSADFADALAQLDRAGIPTVLGVDGDITPSQAGGLADIEIAAGPIPEFADLATAGAHVKVDTDADGVVRSLKLVLQDDAGRFVPSLALAAVLAYRGAQIQPLVGPDGVQGGGRLIPTSADGTIRLNWTRGISGKPGERSVVSATDVYDQTVNPSRFKNKVVFVGATAEAAQDNVKVPVDKSGRFPGVLVHANAANTILTSSYLDVTSDTTIVILIGLLCFVVALAVLFLPLWASLLATLLLMGLYWLLTLMQFDRGHILNLVYPIGMMAITYVAAFMVRYFTEIRHRQRVSRLFAQYVPEAVAQQLVDEGRVDQATEGERLDVSLFFCDLRGFTAMSRSLTPQQVRAMLNEFYDDLTEITLAHNGTVLKFVGDEVFAVFGAPLPVENHPQVALECALAIQRIAPKLSEKLAEMGIPPAYFGIGMNTGEVVAAHVGGGKRRQYDIVGDTVNIGSRMCGQAGKGDIVMPKTMYDVLSDPPYAESMGLVSLKNVEVPLELMRIRADWPDDAGDGGTEATPTATMGA